MDTETFSTIGAIAVALCGLATAIYSSKRSAKKTDVHKLTDTCNTQQQEIDEQRKQLSFHRGELNSQREEVAELRDRITECETSRANLLNEIADLRRELLDALIKLNKTKEDSELSMRRADRILELESHVVSLNREITELKVQLSKKSKR